MDIKKFFNSTIANITIPDAVFLLCLLIFVIMPNTKFNHEDVDNAENRQLAKFPQIISDKKFNQKFGQEFDSFYNDRHRKRDDCIEFYFYVKGFINKRRETPSGLEGFDGWLFCKANNSVKNFQNKLLFTDEELLKIKNNLERLYNWGKKNNIEIIFLIPPDKNRIYGEYFPPQYKKINPKSRVQLLKEYLEKNSDIDLIYPVDNMLERKKRDNEPLYYKVDTHWTATGAYEAYKELINEVNKRTNNDFKVVDINKMDTTRETFSVMTNRTGDICLNMKLKECKDVTYRLAKAPAAGYVPYKYPFKIYFLGDSFSGLLNIWAQNNFITNTYWYNETKELSDNFQIKVWEDKILQDKPDVLVVEVLERFSPRLLGLYDD